MQVALCTDPSSNDSMHASRTRQLADETVRFFGVRLYPTLGLCQILIARLTIQISCKITHGTAYLSSISSDSEENRA